MDLKDDIAEFQTRLLADGKEHIESHALRLHTDLTIEEYDAVCFGQITDWITDFCKETVEIQKICDPTEVKDLEFKIRTDTLIKNDALNTLRDWFTACVDTQLGRDAYATHTKELQEVEGVQ